jgi:hypothetical protein
MLVTIVRSISTCFSVFHFWTSMSAITHILSRLGPRDRARAALVNKVHDADVYMLPPAVKLAADHFARMLLLQSTFSMLTLSLR